MCIFNYLYIYIYVTTNLQSSYTPINSKASSMDSGAWARRWWRQNGAWEQLLEFEAVFSHWSSSFGYSCNHLYISPPARWGLLDFMSVAWSSSSSSSPLLLLSLSSSSRCPPRPPAQLRLAIHSVLCRTSTTTIHAQCSLPDLNHDHPRPVFPAGPQPRPSTPSVPCRTSTTTIHAQCSLPDLNHDHPRPVFPCRTSTTTIHAQCSLPDLNREYPRQKICHIECQKICQIEC